MSLTTSLPSNELAEYTSAQIRHFFPDRSETSKELRSATSRALDRVEYCFASIHSKYYRRNGSPVFSHLMGDQYASFLCFLSREAFWGDENPELATKIYGLNKALHSIDIYYEVELPKIVCFQHTVGTVLGRATHQDYLFVYQRVTVGGNLGLTYPKLGKGVALFGGISIVGDSNIGDNVFVSINTTCNGQNIPANIVAYGATPNLTSKPNHRDVISQMFHQRIKPASLGQDS